MQNTTSTMETIGAEAAINLCRLIHHELYRVENVFKNIFLINSKMEYTKNLVNISSNSFDEIINPLQKMYNRVFEFNTELANYLENFNKKIREYLDNQKDLSEYKETHQSNCVIVNIDNENKIYVYDLKFATEYSNFYNLLYNQFKKNIFKISRILPPTLEVFGIEIGNYFYRVVRKNDILLDEKFVGILIDYGRIVHLSIENNFFLLPSKIQKHPSLAICCEVDNIIHESKAEFLQEGLLKKYAFTVNKNCTTYLQITLTAYTNPFTRYLSANEQKWFTTESYYTGTNAPTKQTLTQENNDNKASTIPNVIKNCISVSTNLKEFLETTLNINEFQIYDKNIYKNMQINADNDRQYHKISEQQDKILSEETITTTNALKAIMGYVPKDELRICQFTNDDGECFKGIHCNKEHKMKIMGGWTRDQAPMQIDIPIKNVIPAVGSFISIIPTHLINVTTFYGHVLYKKNVNETTLRQLTLAMNDTIQINKYRKFSSNNVPQECELVIAKDQDGWYYRARVVSEEEYGCRVFYVDYGKETAVNFTDLRKWEKQFETLPFQAIRFQLVNVKTKVGIIYNKELLAKAEKLLINNFLDLKFVAKVINNINELIVKVYFTLEDNTFDLSDLLVNEGFAEYKGNEDINSISTNLTKIPG